MEPISSDVIAAPRNAPHDLLARLYREIGVSAVAAALGLADEPASTPKPSDLQDQPARQAA